MAELFRYTDEDGDTVVLQTEAVGEYTVNVYHPDEPYPQTCVYLDRAAVLRLSAELLKHLAPAAGPVEGQLLIEEEEHG